MLGFCMCINKYKEWEIILLSAVVYAIELSRKLWPYLQKKNYFDYHAWLIPLFYQVIKWYVYVFTFMYIVHV